MTYGNVLEANNGEKVTILSSQIWGLAQRNIPNSRRHGNVRRRFRMEGFVNGFKEYSVYAGGIGWSMLWKSECT